MSHWTALSVGLSRQEYWSGLPYPLSGDLSNPGIEPVSLMSPALAGRFFSAGAAWEALVRSRLAYSFIKDRVYMLC